MRVEWFFLRVFECFKLGLFFFLSDCMWGMFENNLMKKDVNFFWDEVSMLGLFVLVL